MEKDFYQYQHSHCLQCYFSNCDEDFNSTTSCKIVICENGCGLRFHGCKLLDHSEICLNRHISCINKENGCPVVLQRQKLFSHLIVCPANVITCTMEWNRWPYFIECNSHLKHNNELHANHDQLDVCLALRDQKLLNLSKNDPDCIRKKFCNKLPQVYPAVPFDVSSFIYHDEFSSQSPNSEYASIEEDNFCEDYVHVPSSKNIVSDEMNNSFCADSSQDDSCHTGMISYDDYDIDEDDNPQLKAILRRTSMQDLLNKSYSYTPCYRQPVPDENYRSDYIYETNLSLFDKDNMENNISNDHSSRNVFSSNNVSDREKAIHVSSNDKLIETVDSCELSASRISEELLFLDIHVDFITKYQPKHPNMLTFLCAQEFRRDEYAWHFKNFHSDIHSGLNGWFEQRCPLFNYGCSYSFHRFYPNEVGSKIVYDKQIESFGVQPPVSVCSNEHSFKDQEINSCNGISSCKMFSLTDLPFEVLLLIVLNLDSYGLYNLSLTNSYFRNICSAVLEQKGMVTLEWKKNYQGQAKWEISHKRWRFSTAFSPVSKWGFEDHPTIGQHLNQCKFNKRNRQKIPFSYTEPLSYGENSDHGIDFLQLMRQMYPDFDPSPI